MTTDTLHDRDSRTLHWRDEYKTYPEEESKYPEPEGWQITSVELAGIIWRSPPEPPMDETTWEEGDQWDPEQTAMLSRHFSRRGSVFEIEFLLNGQTLWRVSKEEYEPERELGYVALTLDLARDGEDNYPLPPVSKEARRNRRMAENHSLEEYGI